jgi:PAS domain S-box-containing protein
VRSLEKQLPLAAFLLLTLLAVSITAAAYSEVRSTSRDLYAERLTRLGDQLLGSVQSSIGRSQETLAEVAANPVVVRALAEPTSARADSAAEVLRDVVRPGASTTAALWDLADELVADTRGGASGGSTPPPVVDEFTVTPFTAESDTSVYFSVVTPVRDGRRLVGLLQLRQRYGGSSSSATGETVEAILGETGRILLGSVGGAWSNLRTSIDPPPTEAISAQSVVSYVRAGERRVGHSRTVEGTPLTIVTEIGEDIVLGSSRAFLRRVGGIAALLLLAITGAAWVLGHRITGPLVRLRTAADELVTGEFRVRADEHGHSEIVQVAKAFNRMASETEGHMAALRSSEERFRTLVTATAQIVWWTDPEGNVTDAQPSWQSYTGQSFSNVRGAGWTGALHPDDAATALKVWKEAVTSRSLFENEYRIRRHDGQYRWFLVRAVPILAADGRIREWVATCTDITHRREAEERLQAKELELQRAQRLDAVGRLAGGIAHDFNNLLAAILAPAELASKQLPKEHPAQRDLDDIRNAALRATDLTRGLLAFGRRQVVAPVVVNLNDIVEAGGRLLQRVIGETVRLEVAPKAARSTVRVDRTQIEQIIMNLAVNARDAMPKGGRLTIETSNVDVDREMAAEHEGLDPGSYVVLAVTDTGTGMDVETQKQMFEPFFTTKAQDRGSGLGLSTVYGIVRQAHGHILVYSELGLGTTFKIFLPYVGENAAASVATSPEMTPPRGVETILLADDEEVIRRVGKRILEDLGYTVLSAASGREAVEMAKNHRGDIHLLVSDVVMPEKNGVEVWEALRLQRPALPALFLSGWASDAVVRHGILDGQVPFLPKPFSSSQLGLKVREVLDSQER